MTLRLCLVLVFAAALADAEGIRKWKTPDGRTHFGDRPPSGSVLLGTYKTPERPRSDAETNVENIKARCRRKWPEDYSMQEHCFREQARAVVQLSELYKQSRSPEENSIVSRCAIKWRDGDSFDYEMAVHCAREQLSAFDRMR